MAMQVLLSCFPFLLPLLVESRLLLRVKGRTKPLTVNLKHCRAKPRVINAPRNVIATSSMTKEWVQTPPRFEYEVRSSMKRVCGPFT